MLRWGGGFGSFGTGPTGQPNGATTYSGGGFRLQVPYNAHSNLANVTTWTDSIWFQLNNTYKGYLIDARPDGGYGYDTTCLGGYVTVDIPDASGTGWIEQGLSMPVTVNPNAWTMLTETVTQGQYQLYLNGTLITSVALPSGTPELMMGDVLALGAGDWGGDTAPKGSMAEFQLYDTVLTAAQIKALYLSTVPPSAACPPAPPCNFPAARPST